MQDFTKDELIVMSAGLDALVRNEGHALANSGVAGVGNGVAGKLGARFAAAASALENIKSALAEIDAAEVVVKDDGGGE